MSQALRSPGSTLKPFIYGLGFEDGLIHPETLIEDRATRFESYAPQNFDLSFQGTVTIRKALQLSLNIPAVAVLDAVRASRLTTRLAQAGSPLVLPKGEQPGWAGVAAKPRAGGGVGGPGGPPAPGFSGRAGAAPFLFDAFARLGRPLAPLPHSPKGTIFAATGKLPPPLQRFRRGGLPASGAE